MIFPNNTLSAFERTWMLCAFVELTGRGCAPARAAQANIDRNRQLIFTVLTDIVAITGGKNTSL